MEALVSLLKGKYFWPEEWFIHSYTNVLDNISSATLQQDCFLPQCTAQEGDIF